MKWISLSAGFAAVLMVAAACSVDHGAHDNEPSDIPVAWVNAEIQKAESTLLELLDEEPEALDPKDGADNHLVIENYRLIEWKASEDRYFYEVYYEHPEKGGKETEKMEVIQTEDGWKRASYSEPANFNAVVGELNNPEVLKAYPQCK